MCILREKKNTTDKKYIPRNSRRCLYDVGMSWCLPMSVPFYWLQVEVRSRSHRTKGAWDFSAAHSSHPTGHWDLVCLNHSPLLKYACQTFAILNKLIRVRRCWVCVYVYIYICVCIYVQYAYGQMKTTINHVGPVWRQYPKFNQQPICIYIYTYITVNSLAWNLMK